MENNYLENFEQKCFCLFLLDVSLPIEKDTIRNLSRELSVFLRNVENDSILSQRLEISVMAFNGTVVTLQDPSLVGHFSMPNLSVNASMATFSAINEAIEKVEERKRWYKETMQPYYRPWIIFITSNSSISEPDIRLLAHKIKSDTAEKKYHFVPIGLNYSNSRVLESLSGFIDRVIRTDTDDLETPFKIILYRISREVSWDPELPMDAHPFYGDEYWLDAPFEI